MNIDQRKISSVVKGIRLIAKIAGAIAACLLALVTSMEAAESITEKDA